MSQVETQHVRLSGAEPTFDDAAAGDFAVAGAAVKLIVRNNSMSTITVTMLVPGKTINNIDTPNTPYTILAGASAWIPLFEYLADPTDGFVHWTYSATPSVDRAVVQG